MEVHVTELSTGYPQGEDWVDDDRVLCQNCANPVEVVQRLSMPSEQMEKHRKVNAVPLRWMFEEAKIRGGWATVTWTETCTWILAADVLSWLGISVATANDTTFVGVCTDAANAWAYKARKMAGYQGESLSTVPSKIGRAHV